MNESELKQNITKIEQLLQSENYEAGFELLKTINETELTEAMVALIKRTVNQKYFEEGKEEGFEILSTLLPNLTSLAMSSCDELKNVHGLANLTNLTNLRLISCRFLSLPDGLANCTNLTDLSLENCTHIKDVDDLGNLTNLTELNLENCSFLERVDALANCTKLIGLCLRECESLNNVDGLANLANLEYLEMYRINVKPKPSIEEMATREEVAAYQEEIKKSMK
jgi:Leucine-rich repeat (LRR) protein